MKIKFYFLYLLPILFTALFPQPASLEIVNLDLSNSSFDVEVTTTVEITSIQLTITGVELQDVQFPQGPWFWMMYSYNADNGLILAWTFDTPPIPPGTFIMLNVSFSASDDTELCLEDFTFSHYGDGWTIGVVDCMFLDFAPMINPGDINEDGDVDILDIVYFVDLIMSQDEPDIFEIYILDLNEDGFLDILDVVHLVGMIIDPPLLQMLTAHPWQLDHMSVPPSLLMIPEDQDYVLDFYSDGSFGGQWDCNVVQGEYSFTPPDGFEIVTAWTTLLYCGDESVDQTLSQVFTNVDRISIDDGYLVLTNDLTGASLVFIDLP